MRRVFGIPWTPAAVVGALMLLIAGGSYAIASSGGTIRACANKRNGTLRLARSCRKSERAVTWNVQGPQGPGGTVDTSNFYTKAQSDSRYLGATITVVATTPVNNGGFGFAQAICPTGYQAIGGGVDPGNVFTMQVTESTPIIGGQRPLLLGAGQYGPANAWQGAAVNNSGGTQTVAVTAVCSPIG